MLLLAASLLLYPYYEMARASETPIAFTTDVKGNAYVVESGAGDAEYVSRFDPDGRLAYHVAAPFSGPSQTAFIAIAADNAGNLYAALSSAAVARIDPSGNMVTFPIPISQGVTAIAAGPDGSFYLTGTADAHYLPTTPGAWISAAQSRCGRHRHRTTALRHADWSIGAIDLFHILGLIPYAVESSGREYRWLSNRR